MSHADQLRALAGRRTTCGFLAHAGTLECMPTPRSVSATASRFLRVSALTSPLAAVLASTILITSASAITPVMPLLVDPSAATQVEHSATSLDELYASLAIRPELAGAGVKVAIIDSGIAVYPKNFMGGTADFAIKTHTCFSDAGYPRTRQLGDTRFTNNKVIAARVFWYPPQKANSPAGIDELPATAEAVEPHGSHVAGIVGCNANTKASVNGTRVGAISGVAPRVQLGSYVVFPGGGYAGVGPSSKMIADAVDAAVADGMHIINMSLGSPPSDADTVVLDAVQRAERAGVLVIVAAGNEGSDSGTIGSPGISPSVLTVGSVDGGRELRTTLSYGRHSITVPVGRLGIPVRSVTAPLVIAGGGSTPSLACTPDQIGPEVRERVAVVARGECYFYDKLANLRAAGALGVVLISQPGKPPVALSSDSDRVVNIASAMVAHEDSAELLLAANRGLIAHFTIPTLTAAGNSNQVSSFSSAGPAPLTRFAKPDLVAPGAEILSASTGTLAENCSTSGTCFLLMSGTSMAAPYVAGVAALLKQLHPRWSAAMLRSALIHTAAAASVTGADSANAYRAGLGLIDPFAANAAEFGINATSLLGTPGSTTALGFVAARSARVNVTLNSSQPWLTVPANFTVVARSKQTAAVTLSPDAPPGAIGYITARSAGSVLRIAVRVADVVTSEEN